MSRRTTKPPGCKCPSKKAGERCTWGGWIRCNERLKWLDDRAKELGLSGWMAMNAKTNEPRRGAT